MDSHFKSVLALIVVAVFWSSSGVIIKSVEWSPQAISALRSLVAGLTIIALAGKKVAWGKPSRYELIGAFCMAALSLAFVVSTKMTTAANAIFIQYSAPVWVALAAPLLLRERTSGTDWIFIAAVIVGLGCFFRGSLSMENYLGNLVAICGSFLFAGVALTVRLSQNGRPINIMIYGCLFLGLLSIFFCRPPWPSPRDLALVVLAGVFQLGAPYYVYTLASRRVSSLELVLIPAIEPIINPIWVFLVVGEKPGVWAMIGGAIVLGAITLRSVLKIMPPKAAGSGR